MRNLIFPAAFALALLNSCSDGAGSTAGTTSVKDTSQPLFASWDEKFIGEWQWVENPQANHVTITKSGDNFILSEGGKDYPVTLDKENKSMGVTIGGPIDFIYLKEDDMLLVSGGAGKLKRVSK